MDHIIPEEQPLPDRDLLERAARHLGTTAHALMLRYYGSPGDVDHELQALERTGRLQPSFAELLRRELLTEPALAA